MDPYVANLGVLVALNALLALSVNLVTGYAGQIAFGHAAFLGIGAYTSALLTTKAGLPFMVALPLAGLVGAAAGGLLGVPSLRIRGDFLAVASIGVNFVVVSVFQYVEFFGGALGISRIPAPRFGAGPIGLRGFLALRAFLLLLGIAVSWWVSASWLGLAFRALRADEGAAEVMGVHVPAHKLAAFAISTGLAGLGGSLYAHYLTTITPEDFGFLRSIEMFVWAAGGGFGTVRGPVVGAAVLTLLPEVFRFMENYRLLVYGGVLVLVMFVEPGGLLGDGSRVWTWGTRAAAWRVNRSSR